MPEINRYTLPIEVVNLLDTEQLKTLLSNDNGQLVSSLKAVVKNINEGLKKFYYDGTSVDAIVFGRAQLIDRFLTTLFEHLFKDCKQPVSLIAAGGYGRGELHPGSDVDLMLLLDKEENTETRSLLESFLMLLWDSGLEIGHSVRTIDECASEAEKDITVITNIMEARLICGDKKLFDSMKQKTAPEKIWNSHDFFQAKLDEQIQRNGKFNDTAYNLEPNIKESHGGLRDIQMIGWVAKRHFNATHMHDLVDHDFLLQDEYEQLMEGQNLLWRIRCSLHYLSGRREDRLLFDFQHDLALEFGYTDDDTGNSHNQAIEQFMQKYYRTVMELERLNEMLLQHFREVIIFNNYPEDPVTINDDFQSRHGFLEVTDPDLFEKKPSALLDVFYTMELNPDLQGIRAETIRLIKKYRDNINDEFRASDDAKKLFIKILSHRRGVTHELRRMNRYGILAQYMPAFNSIVGRMQYDLFHAYTVDQHTLFVIRNLRRLSVPDYCQEFPLASGIIHHVKKPHLLYIAGLFHDIAKGRYGDHSELGAVDALEFCKSHHLSDKDAIFVSWLVRNHLIMSTTSQRKDISDPEVIAEFAHIVDDIEHLDALYLLTLCDIRATNPKQWNSWKDNLLIELYNKTAELLNRGFEHQLDRQENIQQNITSASRLLDLQGISTLQTNSIWENFNEDYFLHHTPDEITWHTQSIYKHGGNSPLIRSNINNMTNNLELMVYAQSADNLFALIALNIGRLDLNVVKAQVMLCDNGFSLETFKIISNDNNMGTLENIANDLTNKLRNVLSKDKIEIPAIDAPLPRLHKHFQFDTTVNFELSHDKLKSRINIITIDRTGVLALIARTFIENGIRIHGAAISTIGEKAIDYFDITTTDNNGILNEEQQTRLKQALLETL